MFHVGQKVVCLVSFDRGIYGEIGPVKDAIYTVRKVFESCGAVGIHLYEIVNVPQQYADRFGEMGFDVVGFRPLDERKTDISVFTDILVKAKQPEPA
jgi:hypothetical protein